MMLVLIVFLIVSKICNAYFLGDELLSDVDFSQGFDVIPSCHSDPSICVKIPHYRLYNPFSVEPNRTASWQIAQWASRSNLSEHGELIRDNRSRGMQWSTEDKRFILFEDLRLQLAVNAFHEYDGHYKLPDAPWVHLLVQQDIGRLHGAKSLNEITELQWNFDIQLLYMNQNIQPGYNPNLHAAIFPIYMTIQNLIPGDPDYGKYFWLGINPYDDRVLMSPLYVNGDAGTGSLIYSAAFSNFANQSVHSGARVHVSGDMMPFVRLGLQAACDRGFLHSNDLSRYFVGGMNIGWEITGLNIGTIEVGNLSLKQYTSENPKSFEFDITGEMNLWTMNFEHSDSKNGYWIGKPSGNDPQLLSPVVAINASVVQRIILRLFSEQLKSNRLQLFWSTDSQGLFSEEKSSWITLNVGTMWNEYVLDLSKHPRWHGIIRRLRIDPVEYGDGRNFGLDYIRFSD